MTALLDFKIMVPLIKRDIMENKFNFVWLPLALLGIMTVITVGGVSGVLEVGVGGPNDELRSIDANTLSKGLERLKTDKPNDAPYAVTAAYFVLTMLPWLALPFTIFFTLINALSEERRDKSILFWKSLPISDGQEVLSKLVAIGFVAPFITFALVLAWQLITAVLLSPVVLATGGPVAVLWPLLTMVGLWLGAGLTMILCGLWAFPVLGWLLLASSYAPRSPFIYATLPIGLLIGLEVWAKGSSNVADWLGYHLGGGLANALNIQDDIDGARELVSEFDLPSTLGTYLNSFTDLQFLVGLVVGGLFLWGAAELRRRAE